MRTEGRFPDTAFTRAVTRRYSPGWIGVCAKLRSFCVASVFCNSRQPAKSWSFVTSAAFGWP